MASLAVRAHAQTGRGRGRGRGIPPSTQNSSSSSPPPPRNPPPGLRNTSSPSPSSPAPRNPPPPQRRNNPPVPLPLPQSTINRGHRYTIVQRVQCLTLIIEGFSGADIKAKTGVSRSAQSYIKKRAYTRGFRPKQDSRILEHYV